MNVLLTGGAGYIGSHVIRALGKAGHKCVAYDNLSKGYRAAIGDTTLVVGDINDADTLSRALVENEIETVIHLAALIEAGQSVREPDLYFRNNTLGGLVLLDAMRRSGVSKMVFSSTAGVYGIPERVPILETDRLDPINPYGASKLCVEHMLGAYATAYEMGFVSLRYFNVAGADPSGDIGEDHRPETHLIPLILQVALEKRPKVQIYGDDYDTPDGTCIRDYIHVCDLSDAHVLAIDRIEPAEVKTYNLGNGKGFSVKEVIETSREVTGCEIPSEVVAARPGDPGRLLASSEKASRELGWTVKYPDLSDIIAHAWKWCRNHPDGYGD